MAHISRALQIVINQLIHRSIHTCCNSTAPKLKFSSSSCYCCESKCASRILAAAFLPRDIHHQHSALSGTGPVRGFPAPASLAGGESDTGKFFIQTAVKTSATAGAVLRPDRYVPLTEHF